MVVMVVISHLPQAGRLRQEDQQVVGQGRVVQRLDEQSNATVGQRAGQTGHEDDTELARSGTVPLAKSGNLGRSIAGLVDKGRWGWACAWAQSWVWEGDLLHQSSARRIPSPGSAKDEDDQCTLGMTSHSPEWGPDHQSWYKMVSEVYRVNRCTACEYS